MRTTTITCDICHNDINTDKWHATFSLPVPRKLREEILRMIMPQPMNMAVLGQIGPQNVSCRIDVCPCIFTLVPNLEETMRKNARAYLNPEPKTQPTPDDEDDL